MGDIKKTFKLLLLTTLLLTGSLASAQRQTPVVLLNKVVATMPLIKKGPAVDVATRLGKITSAQEKERLLAPVLQQLEGAKFSKTKLSKAIVSVAEQANKEAERIRKETNMGIVTLGKGKDGKEIQRFITAEDKVKNAQDGESLLVDRAPYLKGENEKYLRGIYEGLQQDGRNSAEEAGRKARNIKFDVDYLLNNLPTKEELDAVKREDLAKEMSVEEAHDKFKDSALEIPRMIHYDREINGDDRFYDEAFALEAFINKSSEGYLESKSQVADDEKIVARTGALLNLYLAAVDHDQKLSPEEKAARQDYAKEHTRRMLEFFEILHPQNGE